MYMEYPPMTPANTVILVSCYTKDTSWADRLMAAGFEVRRYEKENVDAPYYVEKNVGMESSSYLKYCVDNYDATRLPEYTIFLHDEEFSWHHQGSIVDRIIEQIGFAGSYKTLNNSRNLPEMYLHYNVFTQQFYDYFLKEYIGDLKQFGEFMGPKRIGAAQMIIHRDTILSRPRIMYENMLAWFMAMPNNDFTINKEGAILLEYFWGIIWGDVKPLDESVCPRILVRYGGPIQAIYCDQFLVGSIDDADLILTIDRSIPNANLDHFYTTLLDLGYNLRTNGIHLQADPAIGYEFDLRSTKDLNTYFVIGTKEKIWELLGVIAD